MLVELGFISNTRDNELFDKNFDAYAEAIAKGICMALGVVCKTGSAETQANVLYRVQVGAFGVKSNAEAIPPPGQCARWAWRLSWWSWRLPRKNRQIKGPVSAFLGRNGAFCVIWSVPTSPIFRPSIHQCPPAEASRIAASDTLHHESHGICQFCLYGHCPAH